MKAAYIVAQGPPETIQVGDLPDPGPLNDHQVLVEITTSAVSPIDTYLRGGAVPAQLPFPWIPGCDFSGRIIDIGSAVTEFSVGDRVWGSNQSQAGRQGTLAERIAVDTHWVYPIPESVSDEDAAAGALTGITAHLGLHLHGQLQPGETVFVNGGTGGVGSAVVQLAKRHGARVITTVGSDEKQTLAKKLGADVVINYRSEDVAERIRDAIGDGPGINLWYVSLRTPEPEFTIPLLAKRGRMIIMAGRTAEPKLPAGPLYVNDLRLIGFAMFNASPDEQRIAAHDINAALADRSLSPLVGRVFSLDEAAAAHQLQEDNTLHNAGTLSGKIVVRI